ncbi:ABC transporter ATP-binding protein [Metamycoplasma hyosynoviae]|uniref:Chromosome partition protein Smc n=1 Tax=Metamycoplasma hyosynoviae TaxID=29559 RepID=A0A063YI94_9BACT|nr:AAA family ATPase [Metamycoplasma hyosynoviae]KDE41800.1 ABC transporter ATP-binding protein [Metamycoplasma hyosynoviae]KDE42058.1 ABC transporter ATP-binding protein [Metamycoplasma hyosynoviae]KDE42801.1 ABC transporter ATP-binding protein [Metamycoplasma hyosynoviae]KDE43446.1 ABC transporter ATP-binding protein [Metamycoplasma hyosynoviae]KDE44254.1 ABC transporter ATP-binding protein [Metamycoplasma hyosynoviae]
MKLIQVEAHGFKSFADKVALKFDGGVVAIIGPNGSGKSNINDAIRWVLGESSSKALRGDNMEDVIFAGSKTEKEMDRAEVTLTFDNRDHAVSVPHDFFTISRVLHRGKGENEYFINGEPARLRDVKEIAMESGISKSSLAIISQGTISDIAEATPERRREIFEEASGTSMYRYRKIEAKRKLDRTEEALSQISVLVLELEKQLKPLQRQAEKAKVYKEKMEQLKEVEVVLLVHDLMHYSDRLTILEDEARDFSLAKEDLQTRLNSYLSALNQKTEIINSIESTIQDIQKKLDETNAEISNLEIRSAKEAKQREMVLSGAIKVSNEDKKETLKEVLSELNEKIIAYKKFLKDKADELKAFEDKTIKLSTDINELNRLYHIEVEKLNKVKSKIDVIKDVRDNRTSLAKGTKNIVENAHLFKGYKSLVSQLIEVEPKFAKAIETILANATQHIVVDTPETAVAAINFLKQNNGGRATFIPLSSIQPKLLPEQHIVVAQVQNGFLGVASELVNTAKEYDTLKKFLLGNTLVCDTIDNANKLSKLLEKRYMIVTLDGDVIRAGGVMSGGQATQSISIFGIEDQLKQLEDLLEPLETNIAVLKEQILKLEHEKQTQITLSTNFSLEKANYENKLSEALSEFDDLSIKYQQLTNEELELESKVDFGKSIAALIVERSNLSANYKTQSEILKSSRDQFYDLTFKKNEADVALKELLEENGKKIAEKVRAESIIENAKRRLSEQYGLLFETAKQFYKPELDFDVARKLVDNLKQDIRELGHINLEAIEQYEVVQERYTQVKTQEDQIVAAKNTIEEAINEMDKIIVERITQTVELVNGEFKFVFAKMFGGGMAEIRYTDPDNLLDSGIDVIAQPPGKAIKNLKLFSGGEKALIAISLLFAILKAKPLPLCILDEVEAALDEANVIRFAEFLQNLKKETQFIVITHRQGTMERVDKLYGATMQKRGVTTFFGVNLAEAKSLIND